MEAKDIANLSLLISFLISLVILILGIVLEIEDLISFAIILIILEALACYVGVRFRQQNKKIKIQPQKAQNSVIEKI